MSIAIESRAAFTAMSFNIRYETSKDKGSRSWHHRRDGVVSAIRDHSPDILGVQEALHGQVMFLEGALSGYKWVGVGRDGGKEEGECTAMFYKENDFSVVDHGTFWLSGEPDVPGSNTWNNACVRICTWLLCTLKAMEGQRFLFMNVHLDHRNLRARLKSARLILAKMRQIGSTGCLQCPAVILGDFNDIPWEGTLKRLTRERKKVDSTSWLKDAWTEATRARPGSLPRYTWHDFKGSGAKFPASFVRAPIDHVLFTSRTLSLESFEIDTATRGGYHPSDHFPLVATFRLVQ